VLATLLVTLLAPAVWDGCGGEEPATGDRAGEPAQTADEDSRVAAAAADSAATWWETDSWEESSPAPQGLQESTEPVVYASREGSFSITWPAGCAKLYTRVPGENVSLNDFPGTEPNLLVVRCKRWGGMDEGSWVLCYFNETTGRGTPPDPPYVSRQVKKVIDRYQMKVVGQSVIRRGELEGIDVLAKRPGEGEAELRVWGILAGPHYYLIGAWKEDGGLFADPEYERFFQSFRVLDRDER
jgi:hypothetical protein